MDDFWVFGYGSLMWRPGFEFMKQKSAVLFGYHRTLCVHSYVHRGTPDRPGLVLGLDRGGACKGVAFKVAGQNHDKVLKYLRERELITNVYFERLCKIQLSDKSRVLAYCYIVDIHHQQYADNVTIELATRIVRNARGKSGHNLEYVANTVHHLRLMNIRDLWLESIMTYTEKE